MQVAVNAGTTAAQQRRRGYTRLSQRSTQRSDTCGKLENIGRPVIFFFNFFFVLLAGEDDGEDQSYGRGVPF